MDQRGVVHVSVQRVDMRAVQNGGVDVCVRAQDWSVVEGVQMQRPVKGSVEDGGGVQRSLQVQGRAQQRRTGERSEVQRGEVGEVERRRQETPRLNEDAALVAVGVLGGRGGHRRQG